MGLTSASPIKQLKPHIHKKLCSHFSRTPPIFYILHCVLRDPIWLGWHRCRQIDKSQYLIDYSHLPPQSDVLSQIKHWNPISSDTHAFWCGKASVRGCPCMTEPSTMPGISTAGGPILRDPQTHLEPSTPWHSLRNTFARQHSPAGYVQDLQPTVRYFRRER